MSLVPTRGERNNNPLNINYIKPPTIPWNGQVGIEINPPGFKTAPRFGRYSTDFLGIRAGFKQLIKDNIVHDLRTFRTIITDEQWGWAPESDENHPDAYVSAFVKYTGLDADRHVHLVGNEGLAVLPRAFVGFCTVENTRCLYDLALILKAARDALGV